MSLIASGIVTKSSRSIERDTPYEHSGTRSPGSIATWTLSTTMVGATPRLRARISKARSATGRCDEHLRGMCAETHSHAATDQSVESKSIESNY